MLRFNIFLLAAIGLFAQPAKDRYVALISIDGFPAYALDDPKLPIPTLRKLIAEGAAARRMKTINPTVTWPNHTTMVTGVTAAKHGVLYNGLLVRGGSDKDPVHVDPWRDKAELVQAPTVYDAAHKAGLTTAEVDWVAIQNAPTITYSFAERPAAGARIPSEMVEAGMVTRQDIDEFAKGNIVWRDAIWTRAAAYMVRKHKPNLLLFHLLTTDSSHHRYGPRTLASQSALSLADARVAELLQAYKDAGIIEKTTFVVTTDHGFKTVRQPIRANAVLSKSGLLSKAWAVPEGGTAMVYITDEGARDRVAAQLQELFGKTEGVDRVLTPSEFAGFGYPDPVKNRQMADLVLAAKDGYSFAGGTQEGPASGPVSTESTGSHGYLNTDPEMFGIFLAWGRGIRPGVVVEDMRNVDIAPTIAELLGLNIGAVDGTPLRAILR